MYIEGLFITFFVYFNVEVYNLEFKTFVKQRLGELEHTALITYWKINMDKSEYKEQLERKRHMKYRGGNKFIVALAGITGQRVLNKSFLGSYFSMF